MMRSHLSDTIVNAIVDTKLSKTNVYTLRFEKENSYSKPYVLSINWMNLSRGLCN